MPPETAVAVREDQHPIIQKIDAKMPEIAEMLPEGMNADRFRRVVVQALVRNPDLWQCTPVSVVSAIVESAQIGLEPTGVLGRAWMLPYNTNLGTKDNPNWAKEAKLIVGYRGYAELAWRADQILVTTGAVREGDDFAYQRGTEAFLRHVPASDDPEREANDKNITDFWAMYTLPDGRRDFDVMSRKAAERTRERAKHKNPVWDTDFGEMGRKTVLRRLLKVAPLSPEVQRVLGRDEEVDFDTPVARVADDRATAARERITARTDALRAGKEAAPVNDVWMREIHGKANKRGVTHDQLHDWAVKKFGVQSLTELDASQRADMTLALEKLPLIETPGEQAQASEALPAEPAMTPATSVQPDPEAAPSSGPAAPSDAELLAAAGEGAELVPDKPDYVKRAEARAKAATPRNARETPEPAEISAGL